MYAKSAGFTRIIFFFHLLHNLVIISDSFPINNVYEINDALTLLYFRLAVMNDLASDVKLNLDSFDMRAFIDMWPPAASNDEKLFLYNLKHSLSRKCVGDGEFRR